MGRLRAAAGSACPKMTDGRRARRPGGQPWPDPAAAARPQPSASSPRSRRCHYAVRAVAIGGLTGWPRTGRPLGAAMQCQQCQHGAGGDSEGRLAMRLCTAAIVHLAGLAGLAPRSARSAPVTPPPFEGRCCHALRNNLASVARVRGPACKERDNGAACTASAGPGRR